MKRRDFLKHSAVSIPFFNFINSLKANDVALNKNKSCILIWMGGGPPTIDMWDLKTGDKNGGESRPINTSVSGIQISELMPKIASNFKDISIIRSMQTREADHERGTYYSKTGFIPTPSVKHPAFGSVVSYEISNKNIKIPSFIAINPTSSDAGYLNVKHDPFIIFSDGKILNSPSEPQLNRLSNRLDFLSEVESGFIKSNRGNLPVSHKEIYSNAVDLMKSDQADVFDINKQNTKYGLVKETEEIKSLYGDTYIGKSLLLSRRLVQIGVPFIEVNYGGWDLHAGVFDGLKQRLPVFDTALSALISDLRSRGMLENTTIVCMGEFGRTPRINQDVGRDHWANSWSTIIAGGKLNQGQVVGGTIKDGTMIDENSLAYTSGNIWATVAHSMGISLDTTHTSKNGRPMKILNGATAIKQLV